MLRAIILTALSISLLTACGKEEEEEKDSLDYCNDICRKASKCDGAPEQDACEEGCEQSEKAAKEAGCRSEFEAAAKCSERNFECAVDEPVCESQLEDYTLCIIDGDDDSGPTEGARF